MHAVRDHADRPDRVTDISLCRSASSRSPTCRPPRDRGRERATRTARSRCRRFRDPRRHRRVRGADHHGHLGCRPARCSNHGTDFGSGCGWSSGAEPRACAIIPAAHSDADFTLTVTATAHRSGGSTAAAAVADHRGDRRGRRRRRASHGQPAHGNEDGAIPLSIAVDARGRRRLRDARVHDRHQRRCRRAPRSRPAPTRAAGVAPDPGLARRPDRPRRRRTRRRRLHAHGQRHLDRDQHRADRDRRGLAGGHGRRRCRHAVAVGRERDRQARTARSRCRSVRRSPIRPRPWRSPSRNVAVRRDASPPAPISARACGS